MIGRGPRPAERMTESEYDLVIVGAGAAGIAAAHAARDAGIRAIVLEAQDRVGGRAFTDFESFGEPFDHGCQWLHSADVNPLTPMAERLGFRYRRDPIRFRIHDGHWWVNDRIVDDYHAMSEATYGKMHEAGDAGRDVAAATCIDPTSRWARLFRQGFTPYISTEPEHVSVYDVSRDANTGVNWPVSSGMGALIAALANEVERAVEIRLSCPVKSIDWGGDAVMVGTLDGMLFAKTCLVTVSTAVLSGERLKFFPLLPDSKLQAIAQLPMGHAEKVGFEFAVDPFAGLDMHFALMDWPDGPTAAFNIHPFDWPMATLYSGGALARDLALAGPDAMIEHARGLLARLFGAAVLKDIARAKATAWTTNPYIGGAYSVLRPGGGEARAALAKPLDDKLFFAGEATSPDAFATAHGAWQSGIGAVKQILALPQFAR
ncbi:MAG TPA: NAD(P)/FAD-dependent oxidoreductase [Dongiaceae bacterium]|jgi:monoamine oxidase|nr:NAD(P)/FAD-dependent oxidoreductase [Dongiaceae bacterium]